MFGFLAQLLAWCYTVIPNYGVTIIMFTMIVMLAVTPFTVKGMRSMAEMARLQPEMKKLQDQYKNDRVKMNEEMQALFKEHKVNPLGGCLPTLLPLPIFFIIFRLLRGLTGRFGYHAFNPARLLNGLPNPHYIPHSSSLYQHLVADGGKMMSFGMDLGKAARASHGSVGAAIPYYVLIVVMTVSQYVQQQQMNKRNPQAASANPQMKLTMQLFPAFYAVISLTIPASVVLYLLVSGLYRMAQNTLSYKYDPKLVLPPLTDTGSGSGGAKSGGGGGRNGGGTSRTTTASPAGRGLMDRLRAAAAAAREGPPPAADGRADDASADEPTEPKNTGVKAGNRGAKSGAASSDVPAPRSAPAKNGGAAKKAVNVKPARPSTGRVTPRGSDRRPRGDR
jgi:YidC/Oxa1 family membrane protein insertase